MRTCSGGWVQGRRACDGARQPLSDPRAVRQFVLLGVPFVDSLPCFAHTTHNYTAYKICPRILPNAKSKRHKEELFCLPCAVRAGQKNLALSVSVF